MTTSFQTSGYCPICEADREFHATSEKPVPQRYEPGWFRGGLRCDGCNSPPRERAIARVLTKCLPSWRTCTLHESSPGGWAFSRKLARECASYVASQYDPSFSFGEMHSSGRWRNENLEDQTFDDEIFDLVITQDVFEHVFNPGAAAREIARTLKPGGLSIMTVPVMQPWGQTKRRAAIKDGEVQHLLPEVFHGNPVGDGRALVTVDWSIAIGPYLTAHSGMPYTLLMIDDMRFGIRDDLNVILVGVKQPLPDLGERIGSDAITVNTAQPIMASATAEGTAETMLNGELQHHLGVKLPITDAAFTPSILNAIRTGTYELPEWTVLDSLLEPGDRVLEVGAGCGFLSTKAAKDPRVSRVVAVEPNPALSDLIRKVHQMNEVEVELIDAAVGYAAGSAKLRIWPEFWGSRIVDDAVEGATVIDVPMQSLSQVLKETNANVLVIDVEGFELKLFENISDLDGVRALILELHERHYGAAGVQRILHRLMDLNFVLDTKFASGTVAGFRAMNAPSSS